MDQVEDIIELTVKFVDINVKIPGHWTLKDTIGKHR